MPDVCALAAHHSSVRIVWQLKDSGVLMMGMSKRPPFVKVATVGEVPEGAVKHIVVHDKPMALCRVEGSFYAVNAVCPHMGGPLASGTLTGCVITCPWHGWTFDVRSGLPDHPGGHSVSAYEVRVDGDDVLVGWLQRPVA